MSIGPLNEILVSITNIARHTNAGTVLFSHDDKGENNFDNWQKALLDLAEIIHRNWTSTDSSVEEALDAFERLFAAGIGIQYTKETI